MLETGRKSENILEHVGKSIALCCDDTIENTIFTLQHPSKTTPRNNGKPTKTQRGDMVPVVDRNVVHCERSASRRDGVTPGKCSYDEI